MIQVAFFGYFCGLKPPGQFNPGFCWWWVLILLTTGHTVAFMSFTWAGRPIVSTIQVKITTYQLPCVKALCSHSWPGYFHYPWPCFSQQNQSWYICNWILCISFGFTPNFAAAWDGWNFSLTLPSTIECIIGPLETVTMLVCSLFGTDSSRHTAPKLSAWITMAWRKPCEASTFGSSICSIGGRSREVRGAFRAWACGDWSAHLGTPSLSCRYIYRW